MTTSMDQEVELARPSASGNFLERLANRLGVNAKSSVIFGEPVDREGVTVITVAKAGWGFGGGAGSGSDRSQSQVGEGSGGGGGVMISPVGYIEIKDGQARFHPIFDTNRILQLVIGVGFVTMLLLRSIRKFVR